MSGYVVVHATPKDADKMQEYGGPAGESVAKHGGEFVCRGPASVLAGESAHKVMVVIKFASKKQRKTGTTPMNTRHLSQPALMRWTPRLSWVGSELVSSF